MVETALLPAAESWTNWSGAITSNRVGSCGRAARRARGGGGGELGRGETVRVAVAAILLFALRRLRGTLVSLRTWPASSPSMRRRAGDALGGSRIFELGARARRGWVMTTMGDIDRQAIAGAIATGTHGTGRTGRAFQPGGGWRIVTVEASRASWTSCATATRRARPRFAGGARRRVVGAAETGARVPAARAHLVEALDECMARSKSVSTPLATSSSSGWRSRTAAS